VKLLFVTATNTNIGKTFVSLKMINHFSKQNISVGVCKPIETGVTQTPQDAQKLLHQVQQHNPHFQPLTPQEITAYTFPLPAAPFCADTQGHISIEQIQRKIRQLATLCDLLIVEGAGGLMVPITAQYTMVDLAQSMGMDILLVTPSKLGCINDTLLSIELLKSRDLPFEWCVNLHEDKEHFATVTQPYYDHAFDQWWSVDSGLEAFVQRYITTHL